MLPFHVFIDTFGLLFCSQFGNLQVPFFKRTIQQKMFCDITPKNITPKDITANNLKD